MAPNETGKAIGAQQAANVALTTCFYSCVRFKTVTRSKCRDHTLNNSLKYSPITLNIMCLLKCHFQVRWPDTQVLVVASCSFVSCTYKCPHGQQYSCRDETTCQCCLTYTFTLQTRNFVCKTSTNTVCHKKSSSLL